MSIATHLHNMMKNKPLSPYKKKKLIESFCDELTATQAAHRLNLDRNTVNKYFKRIRECIAGYREYEKMKLMIAALSTPEIRIQTISKKITATNAQEAGIPVKIMCIEGQLLTDLDVRVNGAVSKYIMNISDSFNGHHHIVGHSRNGSVSDCQELEKMADDFHDFTSQRLKKFFGVRQDYAYLFIKEAEFVYNEKEYRDREKLLNTMLDKIFS